VKKQKLRVGKTCQKRTEFNGYRKQARQGGKTKELKMKRGGPNKACKSLCIPLHDCLPSKALENPKWGEKKASN